MASTFSKTKCAQKIKDAAKGLLDDATVDDLFRKVDVASGSATLDKAAATAALRWSTEAEYNAFNKKRTAILNFQRTSAMLAEASKFTDPADFFLSYTLGGESVNTGVRNSAGSWRESWRKGQFAAVNDPFRKEGLWGAFKGGDYDEPLAWAMFAKTATPEKIAATPGASAAIASLTPEVKQMADILHNQQRQALEWENSVGGFRSQREGFIFSQSHRRNLIQRVGRQAYTSDLSRMVDIEGTLKNLSDLGRIMPEALPEDVRQKFGIYGASLPGDQQFDPQDFFNSLWSVFTTGVRLEEGGKLAASGSGNVAAKAEQARIIEFKSPAAWLEYNKKYGSGTLAEAWQAQISHSAATIATLKFFGPSASGNFDKAKDLVTARLRKQHDQALKDEDAGKKPARSSAALAKSMDRMGNQYIDRYFSQYIGELSAPGNMALDSVTNNLMGIQRMAKLGGALISSLTDIVTHAATLNIEGVPMGRAIINPILSTVERLGKDDANQYLRQLGVGLEGAMGAISSRLDADMSKPGALVNGLQDLFFKVTGLSGYTDIMKRSYVWTLNNDLAVQSGKGWDGVKQANRVHFERYGIGANEWDLIRNNAVGKPNGYEMLHPDLIRNAPDSDVKAMLSAMGQPTTARAIAEAKLDVETKLRNLFLDGADYASVTPDQKTNNMMTVGRKGTVMGDLARLGLQFKSFPIAFIHKTLMRHYGAEGALGLAKIVGGMTAMGTAVFLLQEWRKGRGLPDPDDMGPADYSKLIMAGFVQGGGAGVLTDLIFQQAYLEGRGEVGSLLGPTGDTLTQPMQIMWKAALKGENVNDDLVRYIRGNTPGANIWWAKPLADHYLWYGLMEAANPGTLERMEKSAASAGRPFSENHPMAGLLMPTAANR